jgi:hypothetical protein
VGLALGTLSAVAEPVQPSTAGPDDADLRQYSDCSEAAMKRVLRLDEASACARVFMKIKLSFVRGVGLQAYDRLPPQEKAAVNLAGYRRYLEWRAENAARLEALENELPSTSAFAAR